VTDDDEVAQTPCPHCGKSVYEEAQRCDHCGHYITQEFTPSRRPWWLVVGVVACLVAVYLWLRR